MPQSQPVRCGLSAFDRLGEDQRPNRLFDGLGSFLAVGEALASRNDEDQKTLNHRGDMGREIMAAFLR